MPTLNPQAQKGLDYLKTLNPSLAASISKSFSATPDPIDIGAVTGSTPLVIPPYNPPPLPIVPQITNTPAQDALDAEQKKLTGDIAALQERQGTKSARKAQLEQEAGLPASNKQLTDITAQLTALNSEADAIPLQIQESFTGRGATAGGVAPIQAGELRKNAIKRLGLSAVASAIQGNVALANDNVQRALAAEFDPILSQIDAKKTLLEANKARFNTEESRRAEQRIAELDRQKTEALNARADKTAVYTVMNTAAKYGAPATVLSAILASSNEGEAISAANQYLQDPKAQYDLQSAKLDNILKQAQIDKTRKETAQIGQPSQKELEDTQKAQQAAKDAIPAITDKINAISGLLTHPGLNTSVGPTPFGRLDIKASLTGQKQDFIAGVQQLVSKDTLDTLVNLKAQGGTLGALSDQERVMLQSAASKIGTWAMRDKDGAVTGYNVDEGSFTRELGTIKTLAERAQDKALGNSGIVTPDEEAAISKFLSGSTVTSTPANFNPAFYFQ